jgi:N-formylglutamate amidohydrolase
VLGDRHGTSCAGALTSFAEEIFKDLGYSVARNAPYAGGFTTERYGKPLHGIHALQIELNRALYMDETTLEKKARFRDLKADLTRFAERLAGLDLSPLAAVL